YGGASWIEKSFLAGSPELLAEICRSSTSYDLHQKLDLYEKAGVREYLAILLYEREFRWQILRDGAYEPLTPDADHVWRSPTFPGLWLDERASWSGNMIQAISTLQAGLASPEHEAFVRELASRRKE